MAKKKKYVPQEDDDWDAEEAKEHRQIIRAKEIAIKKLRFYFRLLQISQMKFHFPFHWQLFLITQGNL